MVQIKAHLRWVSTPGRTIKTKRQQGDSRHARVGLLSSAERVPQTPA